MQRVSDETLIPMLPIEEFERRERRRMSPVADIWDLLDRVKDPEVPVISIWELGVLQDITVQEDVVTVSITPTYSGCPAINAMAEDIVDCLAAAGYDHVNVQTRLQPAWTTSWMSAEAKRKLVDYGIAPMQKDDEGIQCPHCRSVDVKLVSYFGSTACKALYQCKSCDEPFDYFKNL
ncbi:phenylacetate-CoA oxygenase subunit PaaJ [Spongiibacter sp. KMU-166]|uniref:Phenylacetate-CoA oxygenase subunit PaaJ n=1 Tax=Spongiibacter thalassae TaxID=2721624 RepID=A0ABX1GIC2_9GAMM|nr:1,2-phenylacetyl-CoA epoxidase subunit PaaD [Spongiibacter thalassae]NKI18646.1 phenylacetate-CoA oxygenase subunit PaaJ [Spongiibacter thalassae]